MNINFEFWLTIAVLLTGIIFILDKLLFRKWRGNKAPNKFIEYSVSFFPILLIVLLIRSFLYEPYRIPSGSLEPSLLIGDFILVNKYDYGLRLPVLHNKFFQISEPKRGDIVVFRWPADPRYDFIKRVVGLPGDKISYINKVLYVNGKPAEQQTEGSAVDFDSQGRSWLVKKVQENLLGSKHNIYLNPEVPAFNFYNIVVPQGMYFMMGDNRDDSEDSRFWGFVPESNIVGKAAIVVFSWDGSNTKIRWQRTFNRIKGGV